MSERVCDKVKYRTSPIFVAIIARAKVSAHVQIEERRGIGLTSPVATLEATKRSECSPVYIDGVELETDLSNFREIDREILESSDGRQIEKARRIWISLLESNNISFIGKETN